MADNPPINMALIGAGSISQFIHLPGLQRCPGVAVTVACDASREAAEATAQRFAIPAVATDYREVLARPDVDAVVIATPNHLHRPVSLAALAAGKHVLCEKPLGLTLAEAQEMAEAARRSGRVTMVSFVYRFSPAMRYLRHVVASGQLGTIRHFRAQYLQRVPDVWLGWRSQKQLAGSGALGDIGSHLIDFARYTVGEIEAVAAWSKTMVPQRPLGGTERFMASDVDDAVGFLAELRGGVTGVFEASRLAPGRGCGSTEYQCVEVNGSTGTAVYYLQDPFHLHVNTSDRFDEASLAPVPVPAEFLRWPGSARDVQADPAVVGFRYDQAFAFVQAIRGECREPVATFEDGLRCQAVLEAVEEAAEGRRWVDVKSGD